MYLSMIAGAALLFFGGEWLVRGAVRLARDVGLSQLLIGMTIVAAATSSPEFVVSFQAALEGNSDIALGNVVGSNIANVLVILGVAALIRPVVLDPRAMRRDALATLAASVALIAVTRFPAIGPFAGGLLAAGFVAYVWYAYRSERGTGGPAAEAHEDEAEEFEKPDRGPVFNVGLLVLGLAALVIGSRVFVDGAVAFARQVGVPEVVVGLTIVAVGTSLPELAASAVAAARGHGDVSVGNVLGSNLFNITAIIGITALVTPIGVSPEIATFDAWVMLAVLLLLFPLVLWRGRVGRRAGVAMLLGYAAYVWVLVT